jgi:hypothetical protein
MGVGSFLFGSQPKLTDPNIYAWTSDQRKQAGDAAFNQLGGIYATDPQNFWGGQGAWTTAGGAAGGAGDYLSRLFSGEFGFGGGASGASAKGFGASAGLTDMTDESMQMLPSERLRQNIYGAGQRAMAAQAAGAERSITDRVRTTGSAGDLSSPAFLAMMADIKRKSLAAQGEGYAKFEADFSQAAGGRRAAGLMSNAQNKTSASIATAGNKTSASIASAQNRTSASIANAGLRGQFAGMASGAALGVLGLAGRDEDRALDRYRLLNDMNMGWQRPVGQKIFSPGSQGQLGNLFNLGSGLSDMLNRGGGKPGMQQGPYDTSGGYPGSFDSGGFDPNTGLANNTGGGPGGMNPTEGGPMVGPDGQIVSTMSGGLGARTPWYNPYGRGW